MERQLELEHLDTQFGSDGGITCPINQALFDYRHDKAESARHAEQNVVPHSQQNCYSTGHAYPSNSPESHRVSPKAELDSTVEVGSNVIIDEHVKIGAGTKVWANAYITGHTEIGHDNQIHMGAVIGHEPQDLKFDRNCRSYLKIGDRNIFREIARCTAGQSRRARRSSQ